jgi:UDP-glucose 4-epimerase
MVTGCAGNVGSNLTKALLSQGFGVVGVDNFFSGLASNMIDFMDHPAFHFHKRSITEKDFMAELYEKYGALLAVFHLAAIISVPYSMDHAQETLEINCDASLSLHKLAKESGCGAFVFAGSAAEYGRPLSQPAREEDAGDPLSPYGLSKHLVSLAIEESGYGCSLRFFNIYGPTRSKPGPYDGVVRLFLNRTELGLAPTILGDGRQMRDFLFLGDAVRALLMGAGIPSGEPLRGVYNVGTGQGTSIEQLAHRVMRLAKMNGKPEYAPMRQGDIRFSVADNSKLKRDTKWTPDTRLDRGLPLTIEGMLKLRDPRTS